MSTIKTSAAATVAAHIEQFEGKIANAKQVHAQIPAPEFYDELLNIIHKPGWTTLPESLFFEAALASITAQMQLLANAHQQLMTASRLVGRPDTKNLSSAEEDGRFKSHPPSSDGVQYS